MKGCFYMTDKEYLEMLKQDDTAYVDVRDVNIDMNAPDAERFISFMEQIKNPYHFYCGKIKVSIEYTEGAPTLREKLTNYFINNR